jgi:hypothetical protein
MTATDLLIVTSFNRPEMLFLCLEHLRACPELDECVVEIWIDRAANGDVDADVRDVAASLIHPAKKVMIPMPCALDQVKPNYVAPYALARAYYRSRCRYVILVEDDIMVSPDFIRYHRTAQELGQDFCVLGYTASGDRGNASTVHRSMCFSPWGVSWKRQSLGRFVEHFTSEYFRDIHSYVERAFLGTGREDAGWDGLVHRVVRRDRLTAIVPSRSRCFHAGIYGKNRRADSRLRPGTVAEKVAELRERFNNAEWMTKDYQDCRPCSMEVGPWEKLEVVTG